MIGFPRSSVLAFGLAIGFAGGWYLRGLYAAADMSAFKEGLASSAQDQRDLKAKVEAAQTITTTNSAQRLDQQAAAREQEIVYVDREVIHYRDRWRDSACRLPAEWLQFYNRALGVGGAEPGRAVSGAAKL